MNERVDQAGWRSLPIGGAILAPGNSALYETGSWRLKRPVVDMEKCTHCMLCWIFCPDSAVLVTRGRLQGFDLDHCKGCGICAKECPVRCISMVEEATVRERA
ncbi:MAG: 4Fe-4S binding protein [Chloroflexi bacterium]|nr:4Fe-4S binding protein [Chloroflexota bacterium]